MSDEENEEDDGSDPRAENPCHVAGNNCIAPAGYGTSQGYAYGTKNAKLKCYACGMPVCGKCSATIRWSGRLVTRRRRVCDDCRGKS